MLARAATSRLAAPLALIVAVFALYAQTAGHEFVDYDLAPYLSGNPHVLAGLTRESVAWACTSFDASNWHPLTWLSHMLDVELFGSRPAGHHLENAAWHAANALLVMALFARLGLARAFALAGALAFAIHPLRAESVAWFVERKDLLSTFFGLASLLAWLAWRREPRPLRLAGAFALYACSLLSKGTFVTLPCLMLVFELWLHGAAGLRERRSRLALLGFVVLALACGVLTVRAQSTPGAIQGLRDFPMGERLANALDSYVWYVQHTLWPGSLCCHYPWAARELGAARLAFDAALLVAIGAAAFALRRRVPGVLVGWLWYLGALVPLIGIVQVGVQAHADRYSLFPCLGLVFAACQFAQHELLPRIGARALAALGCVAGLALGIQGARQVGYWRDTEVLALHALVVTRDNLVACDLLGTYYERTGRAREALPYLREAVRIVPGDAIALSNLGAALVRIGEHAEAEALLARASEIAPQRWQVWSSLGAARLGCRLYAEALSDFDRAVGLEPGHRGTWTNRAIAVEALLHEGAPAAQADEAWKLAMRAEGPLARPEEALRLAERALEQGGERPELLDALALAAAANGDFARAIAAAEKALALVRAPDPGWAARLEQRLLAYRAGRIDRTSAR